jgi:hypothetical protein
MLKQLNTVEEVILELGGPIAVRQLANLKSPSAVWNWKDRNGFPPKTYTVMKAALRARGADAPDALWNMAVAS